MSSLVSVSSPGDEKTCSSTNDDSNKDLYEADLPKSFTDRLRTSANRGRSDSLTGQIDAMVEEESTKVPTNVEGRTSPDSPYRPSIARRASWDAIDAATAARKADAQQHTAAQEVHALERCHTLRMRIYRKARTRLAAPEPLITPKSWDLSEAPARRLVEHPSMFQGFLEVELGILNLIEIRIEVLRSQILKSPKLLIVPQFRREMECLEIFQRRRKDMLASRLLVDLLLETFRHATAKLLTEIMEKDETKKTPISELCYCLSAYSTYPGNCNELVIAAQDIEEMEREHLPWRYKAVSSSRAASPTSSMSNCCPSSTRSASPVHEIRLSPEPIPSLPSTEDPPLKNPTRLRVKFQDCVMTRTPAVWRRLRKSLPSISSNPRDPSGSPVSQSEHQRAVRTVRRAHCRNADISHLTHPIVMMGIPPTPYMTPLKGLQPPQTAPPDQQHTTNPPEPVGSGGCDHPFAYPIDQSEMPTLPATAHPQNAWPRATVTKRRASEDISSAYYDEPKKARIPDSHEAHRNSHNGSISSVDQTQENAQYTSTGTAGTELAQPPRNGPSSKMAVALAIAQAKRDAKYTQERSHTYLEHFKKPTRRFSENSEWGQED